MKKIPHDMQAALVVSNGFIGLGGNHGDAAMSVIEAGFENLLSRPYCEGFYSEEYGFLYRTEAFELFGHSESGDMAYARQEQEWGTKGRRRSPCGFDGLPEFQTLKWLTHDLTEDVRADDNLMKGFDCLNTAWERCPNKDLRLDLDGCLGRTLDLEKHWGFRP